MRCRRFALTKCNPVSALLGLSTSIVVEIDESTCAKATHSSRVAELDK
jgi:hypothetical protein